MDDFFFVSNRKKFAKILFVDILYIEALKKYIKIFTTKETHVVSVSLSYAERKLPKDIFCRIHKSYVISLKHLKYFDSEFAFIADKGVPIGKHYKAVLNKRLDVWGRRSNGQMKPNQNCECL